MGYYWHGPKLKNFLLELCGVKKIRIATAYLSWEGLSILNHIVKVNNLSYKQVNIYLSPEFCSDKPGALLKELCAIGEIFIVERMGFHPKVYFIETNTSRILVFGSSNLTNGGIQKNIEFDLIKEADEQDNIKSEQFFTYCANYSIRVTQEVITEYESYHIELQKLKENERSIRRKLFSRITKTDSFDELKYDLKDFYFQFHDYEILFLRNQELSDAYTMGRRKDLQDKILNIHKKVNNDMKKIGLHCHWNQNHITTQITPSRYNKGKVSWLGVRYGKNEFEVKALNYNATKDETLGFQKHACIQFSIGSEEFSIGLFHAVPHDAIDRSYLHKRLENSAFQQKIIWEIDCLKGYEFIWYIHNNGNYHTFDLDKESASDFIKFYRTHDRDGVESFLSYNVSPDDEQIRTIDSINKLVLERIKLLLPLYNLLAYRPPLR